MSNRAIDAVKDFSRSKGSERLLLFMIADGISKDSGLYDAKIRTLAEECNMSERWVQKLIPRLIALGELIAVNHPGFSASFYIPIFAGELGYDPQPCDDDTHDCMREHTPMNVSRETVRRDEWNEQRRQQRMAKKGRRKIAGVNDDSPLAGVNDSTPPGEREFTPGVNDDSPGSEREFTTSTLLSTHSLTTMDTHARATRDDPSSSQKKLAEENEQGTPDAPLPPPPLSPDAETADERDLAMPLPLLWSQVAMRVRQSDLTDAEWSNWIAPLRIARAWWDDDRVLRVRIIAPGSYHAEMIEQRFVYVISDAIGKLLKLPTRQVGISVHAARTVKEAV